jgi:hypothetical protein
VTEKGYRLALLVPQMDPAVVRWLLPGEVRGGTLSGTLNIGGNDREPVTFADGHFDLRNAKYVAPAAFQIADTATPVSRFSGDYAWNTKGTRLTNLQVESPLLTATGTLTADG